MSSYSWKLSERSLTFVCVAESSSEGAAHSDVPILQVLQHQILNWNWLPVHLEALALVSGDGAGQDQQVSEQEYMKLLKGFTRRNKLKTRALLHISKIKGRSQSRHLSSALFAMLCVNGFVNRDTVG